MSFALTEDEAAIIKTIRDNKFQIVTVLVNEGSIELIKSEHKISPPSKRIKNRKSI